MTMYHFAVVKSNPWYIAYLLVLVCGMFKHKDTIKSIVQWQ